MSLHHRHIFHYLANKEINEVYISMALLTLSESLIAIFVPIYLLTLNFPIYQIIFFYLLWSIYYTILTPFLTKLIPRLGVKHTILLSMPFLIIFYLGLNYITINPFMVYILPLIIAIHSSLFNASFHLNFIGHADKKRMGRELSLLYIILTTMHLISPFVGGLLIYNFGFQLTYMVGAILVFLSIAPLFFTKDTKNYTSFTTKDLFNSIKSKKNLNLNLSYIGYSIENSIHRVIWPIFIFLILQNIKQLGLLTSLTMILAIIVFFFVGKLTDTSSKKRLIKLGTIFYSIGWFFRLFVNSATSFLIVDSYKNASYSLLFTPWSTRTYNLAMRKKHFIFIVAREIVFNIPRIMVLPPLMILFFYAPTNIAFFTTFLIAGLSSLLYSRINKVNTT